MAEVSCLFLNKDTEHKTEHINLISEIYFLLIFINSAE